jgi:hypothetical protein
MTSITFYRCALLLPYLSLIPGYFFANQSASDHFDIQFLGMSWVVLAGFWITPYTILVVGLLAWSRGKSTNTIRSLLLKSPLMLMIVAPVVLALFGIFGSYSSDPNVSVFFTGLLMFGPLFSALFSFVVGYLFVIIGLLLYNMLNKFGYIKDDIRSDASGSI